MTETWRVPAVTVALVLGLSLWGRIGGVQAVDQPGDAAAIGTALAELKAGRMYEGLAVLREVLRRDPAAADAHFYLGMIYSEVGRQDIALRHAQRAVDLSPGKGAYHNQVGVVLSRQKRIKEALEAFKKALESRLDRDRGKVWRNLGLMHEELLQWPEAIGALRTALDLEPEDHETRRALGRIYLDQNRLTDAIRALAPASHALEPAEVSALLGMAQSRAGKPVEALDAFQKALLADPGHEMARYDLAQTLMKLGRVDEAHQELEEYKRRRAERQELERRGYVVDSTFQAAMRRLEEGKPDEAARLFRQALAVDPGFAPAQHMLGLTLVTLRALNEAIAPLEEAVALTPLNAVAYFYLGAAYAGTGKLEQALGATARAIVIYDEDARYHNQLGEIQLGLMQRDEARRSFEQAVRLDERLFAARLNLGRLALQEGRLALALKHLKAAVDLNSRDAQARQLLGEAYLEDRQVEEAISQHREALQLSPMDERLHLALGKTLIRTRQLGEAEQVLTAALRSFPDSPRVPESLAELHLLQGHFQHALEWLQKVIALEPKAGIDRVHVRLGDIYYRLMRFDDAIASYQKALAVNPKLAGARRALGAIYVSRTRYEDALDEYTAALAIDPRRPDVLASMGQVHLRMRRDSDAADVARKALELDPARQPARYTLATALVRLGKEDEAKAEFQKFQQMQTEAQEREHRRRRLMALNQEALVRLHQAEYDKAIALFRKAIDQDPEAPRPYLNLALALAKAGNDEEAIASFQRALALQFDHPEVHRHLATLYERVGKPAEGERELALYQQMKEERLRRLRQRQ